jgi:choline dehydrogenase-like flavoprotein
MAQLPHLPFALLLSYFCCLFSSEAAIIPQGAQIKRDVSQLESHYDYIIAGGGTSGLTIADRLTAAFPQRTVLVVEYGQLVNSTVILQPAATVPDPRYAFQITSQPEPGLNNRRFTVTVGNIVGGCSAINAQMFDRGSTADYDAWGAVTGDEYKAAGWTWEGLLPYFKKSVTFTEPTKEVAEKFGYTWDAEKAYGGKGGIHASYPPFQWPSESKVIDSAFET